MSCPCSPADFLLVYQLMMLLLFVALMYIEFLSWEEISSNSSRVSLQNCHDVINF